MPSDLEQQFAMLSILHATCGTSLDAFRAAGNPIDEQFVEDLERITERTRQELETLAAKIANPS